MIRNPFFPWLDLVIRNYEDGSPPLYFLSAFPFLWASSSFLHSVLRRHQSGEMNVTVIRTMTETEFKGGEVRSLPPDFHRPRTLPERGETSPRQGSLPRRAPYRAVIPRT